MKSLKINFILLKIKRLNITSPRVLCYGLKNRQYKINRYVKKFLCIESIENEKNKNVYRQ